MVNPAPPCRWRLWGHARHVGIRINRREGRANRAPFGVEVFGFLIDAIDRAPTMDTSGRLRLGDNEVTLEAGLAEGVEGGAGRVGMRGKPFGHRRNIAHGGHFGSEVT